jgi:hypothetical protein
LLFSLFRLSALSRSGAQRRLTRRLIPAVQLNQGIIRVVETIRMLRRQYYRTADGEVNREVEKSEGREVEKSEGRKVERSEGQTPEAKFKVQMPKQGQCQKARGKTQMSEVNVTAPEGLPVSSLGSPQSAFCNLQSPSSFCLPASAF